LVVVCGLVLALGGGVAQAGTAYIEVGSFGQEGAGAGQFNGPTGVAIQQSTGDVYVVDGKNLRVQKFGPAGEFILAFGKSVDETTGAGICTAASHDVCKAGTNGSEPGQFGEELFFHLKGPTGIAVDPETGDVYVADRFNRRIETFSAEGAYLGQFSGSETPAGAFSEATFEGLGADDVAVDPVLDAIHGGHDVYVADAGNSVVDVFDTAGTYLRQLTGTSEGALSTPDGVAFDSAGNAYVLDRGNRSIDKFTNGEGEGAKLALEKELTEFPEAIALDTAGDIFVDEHGSGVAHAVEFGPTGNVLVREFGEFPAAGQDPSGIAVKASGIQAYLSGGYSAAEAGDKVSILEEKTGPAPLATTGAPSAINATDATLAGKVDPEGSATKYWFKYGPTDIYGSETPHEPAGDEATESEVKANLEGLAPSETYHYRLVARSAFGEVEGNEETFTTKGEPPTVESEGVFSFDTTETSAVLHAQISPENRDTRYYFQYGTDPTLTSNVSTIPALPGEDIGSSRESQSVNRSIEGTLTPNTVYYYRAVATNGAINGNGTTDGPIKSFITWPLPPTATTGGPSEITDTSATLSGTLDGMGADTHYYFDYAEGAPGLPVGPGEDAGVVSSDTVSTQLTGLVPNTTYHYQLVAYNELCTFLSPCPPPSQSAPGQNAAGLVLTFTTRPLPPGVSTDLPVAIGTESATLTGVVTPPGVSTTYYFKYGTSSSYGSTTPVGEVDASARQGGVAASITGLLPQTTYHYVLVATDAGGTVEGAEQTLTTGPALPGSPETLPAGFSLVGTPVGAPAAAAFSSVTGLTPTPAPKATTKPKPKALTNAQKLSQALKACKRQVKKKRAGCKAKARKTYGSTHKAKKSDWRSH
jgi:hypothetical protein